MLQFLNDKRPILIACAGTLDKDYLAVLTQFKKNGNDVPTIMFSDTQWRGRMQWANVLLSKWRHRKWFTHVLVAGIWQYEYARCLGFPKHRILMPYLSADDKLFKSVDLNKKRDNWPKKLLFCGRFAPEKGLDLLYKAWNNIDDHLGWTLTLIGEGPERITNGKDTEVLGYKTQPEIVEYMKFSGAFILPSRFEPWALVIHEAALAGLPIIVSDCVGASTAFCINGSNSLVFKSNNVKDLEECIRKLIKMENKTLYEMGKRSRMLGDRITGKDVADAILSVIR